MTRYQIIEKLEKRFNVAERTTEEFRLKTKPLSRKKLRQLMPLNHRNLTSQALEKKGHRYGSSRYRIGAPKSLRMSALDGGIVVKPRRVR